MYRVIDGKGTGKTSKLMSYAKENNAVFVCRNPYAMEEKARSYGIIGINFMSYTDFASGWPDKNKGYVIDELEQFIKYTTPFSPNIVGYTLSSED